MLFNGAFDTAFYRKVRDALHLDVELRRSDMSAWAELSALAPQHRLAPATVRLSA
jgi:anaerobic magnesium-protoporphyrin IX monomethyl ester cyclase